MNTHPWCNGIALDAVTRLHQQRDTIVAAWYQELIDVQFVPQCETVIRQHLTDIFEQIITLLKAPALDTTAARTIGAILIEAGFDQPASLGCTIEVLMRHLLSAMTLNDNTALVSPLLSLQRAVIEGFTQRMRSRDMIEQHEVYAALRDVQQQTRLRLQMLLQHLPIIFITIDNTGSITSLEGKRLATLAITPEKLVGRSIYETAQNLPDIQTYVARSLQGETLTALVEVLNIVFQTWWHPLYGADHTVTGITIIALDVTMRMRFETELTELRWQLQLRDEASMHDASDLPLVLDTDLLTQGEHEVLQLVVWGKSNPQIADTIGLSRQGVTKRLSRVFTKLGVGTRTEATARALQLGLVAPLPQNEVDE
jgi:DNA-binding CsgD family transcriptional regulator/PAS domain-containing protein